MQPLGGRAPGLFCDVLAAEQLLHAVGEHSEEQPVEHEPDRPDIRLRNAGTSKHAPELLLVRLQVVQGIPNLWGSHVERVQLPTAAQKRRRAFAHRASQAQVPQLRSEEALRVREQEDILRFEVAMDEQVARQQPDGVQQLPGDLGGVVPREEAAAGEEVVQRVRSPLHEQRRPRRSGSAPLPATPGLLEGRRRRLVLMVAVQLGDLRAAEKPHQNGLPLVQQRLLWVLGHLHDLGQSHRVHLSVCALPHDWANLAGVELRGSQAPLRQLRAELPNRLPVPTRNHAAACQAALDAAQHVV
mmetsp:Transcript_19119/g.54517  ORF Transcript_19119/g.54517 Transcript_19119/m.54517 type:complete len:300 (+) Transcript_19119:390-1289(+)